jgi:hypothetical protein
MTHLNDEQWVEYLYREGTELERLRKHVAGCPDCTAQAEAMAEELGSLQLAGRVAERGPAYGESVWRAVGPSLQPRKTVRRTRWLLPAGWGFRLGLAAAALALVAITVVAFNSGRWWQQRHADQFVGQRMPQTEQASGQRVILFVVSDHLERSQKLLAELDDPDQAARDRGLQATARELLTENRLYRQSTERASSGDGSSAADGSSLETILEDLEPVLVELANEPEKLDRNEILRLRQNLNTGGVLFEIRMLRSRVQEQTPTNSDTDTEGKA